MRNLVIFTVLLMVSCHNNTSDINTSISQNSESEFDTVRKELDHLKSISFETPDQFLISPTVLARDEYYEPHWWSHWKEQLDYREDNIPQGVILYAGSPGEDEGWGMSMKWNNCQLYQNEHFSFSKTGQLQNHVYVDSTRFHYDSNDRLRQSVAYSDGNNEIEYIRLYDYDEYGNIQWNAVFYYESRDSLYLNHYDSYNYVKRDSGIYVKKDHHLVNTGKDGSLNSSVKYLYFDNEQVLRRKFEIFHQGTTGITYFDYKEFDGKYYLTKKATRNILDTKERIVEIKKRDSLNRITCSEYRSGGIIQPILLKDSIVYFPNNETYHYHYDYANALSHSFAKKKFDTFNNLIHEESFRFHSLDKMNPQTVLNINYELLEKGTWYSSVSKTTHLETDSPYIWEEYQYRKFLDQPVVPDNSTYQENSILMKLIEKYIPEPIR